MLGLMGTLIPMGPALVGLSTGDIASMAYNMQVAFATTAVSYTQLSPASTMIRAALMWGHLTGMPSQVSLLPQRPGPIST